MVSNNELRNLQAENARLKSLLAEHGIDWSESSSAPEKFAQPTLKQTDIRYSPEQKIHIFMSLFRGRTDVYPRRWESAKGKSGYSPACANEWKRGICFKPKAKCGNCGHRSLLPLTEQVVFDHLSGKHCVGIYPLLADETCYFLAMDFDESEWRDDVAAVIQSCQEFSVPAAIEISRSGNGAHIWIFFASPVPAVEARRLGAALLSHACARSQQLALSSYDRFFPNQDTLPKGGFGNLIALPLQKRPRANGHSVFTDERFIPHDDQWHFLATVQKLSPSAVADITMQASGGRHPLDIAFVSDDESSKPWERSTTATCRIAGPLPSSLQIIQADRLYITKQELPQPLRNRLIRLAAFQNPEFYKAQAMRLPVWSKPRIIGCAENFPQHIALPRGCLDALIHLLEENGISPALQDKRITGTKIRAKFQGKLKAE